MSRSYQEAVAERRARVSTAGRRQNRVFADAYGMAVQLMELREHRHITQVELAEATGIHQSEISRIERGAANPTEKTLLRIADALGADLRLVERPETMPMAEAAEA
jgi:DNA-binding XRE family transcriptional regulator